MYHLTIKGTPFAWKRATQDRAGRRVNPKAMREHQKAIAQVGCQAFLGRAPLFGPVKVFVAAVFAIPPSWSAAERAAALAAERYRDIDPDSDRVLNEVLDGLKFVAFVDDCQVADCRCVMRYGEPERTDVWIDALPTGNRDAGRRRERLWKSGHYNGPICKAPCGQARWPLVINADAHRLGLELVR